MTREEVLQKLETTLESFITRVVTAEGTRLEAAKSLESLGEIAQESLRGRYVNNRLARWMSENKKYLEHDHFDKDNISRIGSLFANIQSGLDLSDPESKKLSGEIDNWKSAGAIPKRKLVLKTPQKPIPTGNLLEVFVQYMKSELEYVETEMERSGHILMILDDALKSAEAKDDPMYVHLAGSMIYFMKSKGYKVGPFVKRLKEIEHKKNGQGNDR